MKGRRGRPGAPPGPGRCPRRGTGVRPAGPGLPPPLPGRLRGESARRRAREGAAAPPTRKETPPSRPPRVLPSPSRAEPSRGGSGPAPLPPHRGSGFPQRGGRESYSPSAEGKEENTNPASSLAKPTGYSFPP